MASLLGCWRVEHGGAVAAGNAPEEGLFAGAGKSTMGGLAITAFVVHSRNWLCRRDSQSAFAGLNTRETTAPWQTLYRSTAFPNVPIASDGDAVFRPLELGLKVAKLLIGRQLRVVFGHRDQSGQGTRQLVLGGLELQWRKASGICLQELGGRLDRSHLGSRSRVTHQQNRPVPARRTL